jgi:hypothetical protein
MSRSTTCRSPIFCFCPVAPSCRGKKTPRRCQNQTLRKQHKKKKCVSALAWRSVLTVSRGYTATAEALIAAAPATAWTANTLSPSGLLPPTISAACKAGTHPPQKWRNAASDVRQEERSCGGIWGSISRSPPRASATGPYSSVAQ